MDIVDTQFHLFMTMDDEACVHVMDALGIKSVLVDEAWQSQQLMKADGAMPGLRLGNGEWRPVSPGGQMASLKRPDRFSFQLRLNPEDPEIERVMAEAASFPGCRAFRYDSRGENEVAAAESGARLAFFRIAEKLGIPVSITALGRVHQFVQYFRACPSLVFILDHCGLPKDPAGYEVVLAAAQYPNVHLKWSHAPLILGQSKYPFADIRPFLHRAIDAFGRERIMWASDFTTIETVSKVWGGEPYSWAEALFYIRDDPELTESDKEWLLGRTARKVLNWEEA